MARVLIAGFCSLPGPNRAGVQLGHVLRALGRRNGVDVLCVRRGDQAYVERRGSARILRVPVSDEEPLARVETFRRALRRQLEGADYDAVVVRDSWSGIPALEMRDSLGYALVFDAGRSPMAEARPDDNTIADLMAGDEDECVRAADMVLAPTEAARQYLATRAPPERVHTVPLGVDIDLFDWDDPPRVGPDRVLCAGSFGPSSGLPLLLASMKPIFEASDAQLVIAGDIDPAIRPLIEHRVRSDAFKGRVELLGELDHRRIPELIATAAVCVTPDAVELSPRPTTVFPTKTLEYLACRRAVIAPRRGTVTLLMRDRQHGLLFNPGDVDSLTTQLARLLGDVELRERLAHGGYEMVRRANSASGTRRAVRRAFSWLATQGPWAEKWSRTDEVEDVDLLPIGISSDAEITESIGFEDVADGRQARVRAPISYTAEQTLYVSDDVSEPEDHTVVEGAGIDTRESPLRVDTQADDWVVDESAEVSQDFQGYTIDSDMSEDSSPVGSRFVAGEVIVGNVQRDSPTMPSVAVDVEPEFTAMSPLLGTRADLEPAPVPERSTAPPPLPARRAAGKTSTERRAPRATMKDAAPPQSATTKSPLPKPPSEAPAIKSPALPRPRARVTVKSPMVPLPPRPKAFSGPSAGKHAAPPPNTPTPTVKMGPPARVSASDAVRSALSAAKRARDLEAGAPNEHDPHEAKTLRLERDPPDKKKT